MRPELQISLKVNDQKLTVPVGTTLDQLLIRLELENAPVAVEKNAEICPKDGFGTCILEDGDKLEIVSLVGGG